MQNSKPLPSRLSGLDGVLAEQVEELSERLRTDPAADMEAFLHEHAEFAERLRPLLPAVALMAELGRSEIAGVGVATTTPTGNGSPAGVDAGHSGGVLGDFRILREIGRGGMGVVYEAEQISLKRRVALKVLPFAAMLDPRHLARFRNEAQAAAQLHHTNIVPVFAVGSERNVYYYAMQHIEGQTLDAVIKALASGRRQPAGSVGGGERRQGDKERGRQGKTVDESSAPFSPCPLVSPSPCLEEKHDGIPAESGTTNVAGRASTTPGKLPREYFQTVAELGIQAAEALDYAHEHGVVHRDIKPSNLILDEEGNLWVTDFGLARIESESNLTMTGDILGTLRYMSPEQALAKRPLLDHRTDIYSLGVTLYELLTLQPAFPETDRRELLRQIADEDPRHPRSINKSIPAELETIVEKAMCKDAAERYATAAEMADDLGRFIERKAVLARPPGIAARIGRWSRRHRMLVGALAAICLVVLASAVGLAVWIDHARHEVRLEQAQRDARVNRAEQAARLAKIAREADRKAALAEKRSLNRYRYVMQINRANQSFQQGQFADARQHLAECRPESDEPDLRDFEWHYLWKATIAGGRFVSHLGPVYRMTFSPDGRMLATGGIDGVRVWDFKTRKPVVFLPHHIGGASAMAFSPDGRSLATAGADGAATIWNTTTWTMERRLPIAGLVFALGYFGDGSRLGSARRPVEIFGRKLGEGSIQAWDTSTWRLRDVLPERDDNHRRILGGSDDGSLLALRGDDNTTCIWDVPTGIRKYTVPGSDVVDRVVFAHHSPLFAAVIEQGDISLRNIADGTVHAVLPGRLKGLESLDFSHDDATVAAVADRLLSVWEKRGESSYVHTGIFPGDSRYWSVSFAPDEANTLLTANHAGAVQRWNRRSPQHALTVQCEDSLPIDLRFSPDGSWAATAGPGVQAHALDSSAMLIAVAPENGSPWHAEFSPDSRLLAAYNRDVGVAVWDVENWAPLWTTPVRGCVCRRLKFFMTDRRLLFVPADADPQCFDIDAGNPVSIAATPEDARQTEFRTAPSRFSAHRRWGVLEVHDGNRMLWSIDVPMHSWTAQAFSNDGAKLAASLNDGTIYLWDSADKSSQITFIGRVQRSRALAISNDKRTLASEGPDNTVTLWNIATGLELLALDPGLERIDSLGFSARGSHLEVRGSDHHHRSAVVIWHTGPAAADPGGVPGGGV